MATPVRHIRISDELWAAVAAAAAADGMTTAAVVNALLRDYIRHPNYFRLRPERDTDTE